MTESTTNATPDDRAESNPDRSGRSTTTSTSTTDVRRYLQYALLAGLSLLAFVAALQFYVNAAAAIDQWIAAEYRSLFKAAFNLVVLLVAGAGIAWQADLVGGDE